MIRNPVKLELLSKPKYTVNVPDIIGPLNSPNEKPKLNLKNMIRKIKYKTDDMFTFRFFIRKIDKQDFIHHWNR